MREISLLKVPRTVWPNINSNGLKPKDSCTDSLIGPKRSKQLVYVNTSLQKILKGAYSFRSKLKILKGANSFGEQILSLKDRKTAILNAQNIRMLQIHVNNDIYNKYFLIYNNLIVKVADCYTCMNINK